MQAKMVSAKRWVVCVNIGGTFLVWDVGFGVVVILFWGQRKVHPSMSGGKLYFVVNGLNDQKIWLRSYS